MLAKVPAGKIFKTVFLSIVMMSVIFCTNDKAKSADNKTVAPKESRKPSSARLDDSGFSMAPDFALEDLNGEIVRLSDYSGKVVFVNFWATWCPPCRAEIPYFIELISEYGEDGFVVLGIDLDPRDFSKVPDFVKKQGINYPVLYDNKGISDLYGGIQYIPTTFVVNRNGKIVEQIQGSRPKADFERILKQWL